jgi:hypothetical protein
MPEKGMGRNIAELQDIKLDSSDKKQHIIESYLCVRARCFCFTITTILGSITHFARQLLSSKFLYNFLWALYFGTINYENGMCALVIVK